MNLKLASKQLKRDSKKAEKDMEKVKEQVRQARLSAHKTFLQASANCAKRWVQSKTDQNKSNH
jgi:hypothetical protein